MPVAFDSSRYEQDVIRPLRSRHGGLPDGDLLAWYAIDATADLTPHWLEAHLRELRAYWRRKANGPGSHARVCSMLLSADADLSRRVGDALYEPQWWRERARERDQRVQTALARLTADLSAWYGELGLITPAQLAALAAQVVMLRREHIDKAVRAAQLRVIEPVPLPGASGMDREAYDALSKRLGELGSTTVIHLLRPDRPPPFSLLGEPDAADGSGLALDASAVEQRIRLAQSEPDGPRTRMLRSALGMLRNALDESVDLRTVAMFQIVEQLLKARASGVSDRLLAGMAADLGVVTSEANLIVASLPRPGAAGAPATAFAVDSVSPSRAAVEGAAEKGAATIPAGATDRTARSRHLASPRPGPSEASPVEPADSTGGPHHGGRGPGDPGLDPARPHPEVAAAHTDGARSATAPTPTAEATGAPPGGTAAPVTPLAELPRAAPFPPGPPDNLVARVVDEAVHLTWQSMSPQPTRYRVIRTTEAPPRSVHEGVLVAETPATTIVDQLIPVARRVHYGVFTSLDGYTWSAPSTATACVLPPVTDTGAQATRDRVVGSWRPHPAATGTQVSRTAGQPDGSSASRTTIPATRESFVDDDVREGVEYQYWVTAMYRDERGRDLAAPPVHISAVPGPPGQIVQGMTVEYAGMTGSMSRVRVRWPTAGRNSVRIRRFDRSPPWDVGDAVPVEKLDRYGHEVVGDLTKTGTETALDADVPVGYHVYVPFAIGGTGAVVGRWVARAVAEPVRQLRARVTGDQVVISWVWPPLAALAEVDWATDQGTTTRRITRAQYGDDNGCRLPYLPSGGEVAVRTITIEPGSGQEASSPPITEKVRQRQLRIGYTLNAPRGAISRFSRRRAVTVSADDFCAGLTLLVVISSAVSLPLRPQHGIVIGTFGELTLELGKPMTFQVQIPGSMRRPLWIRCFIDPPDGITVVDPGIDDLKVT